MKHDTDTLERLKTVGLFALQAYKVSMGSLLSLVVPQECAGGVICTVGENLSRIEPLHTSAVIFNFLTLCAFVANYYVELKRENWFIKHFDVNHNYADLHLRSVLVDYLPLREKLWDYNRLYWMMSMFLSVMFVINVTLSTADIYSRQTGGATVNAYLSFIILITMKLFNSLSISYHSQKNDAAQSAFLTEFTSFNILDRDEHPPKIKNNMINSEGVEIEMV